MAARGVPHTDPAEEALVLGGILLLLVGRHQRGPTAGQQPARKDAP
jgi:hypothetical protein